MSNFHELLTRQDPLQAIGGSQSDPSIISSSIVEHTSSILAYHTILPFSKHSRRPNLLRGQPWTSKGSKTWKKKEFVQRGRRLPQIRPSRRIPRRRTIRDKINPGPSRTTTDTDTAPTDPSPEQEEGHVVNTTTLTDDKDATTEPKLSKSQIKKKRRLEHKMAIKKRRKEQERQARIAKAVAAGRDLEAERREQEARAAAGVGKERRANRWAQRLQLAQSKFQVGVDCAFESSMTAKEINSLALQLRYCYATNRRVDIPCLLAATSVTGQTMEHLQNVPGFEQWGARGFTCTATPLEEYYAPHRSALVYLTSDSENVLQDLDDSKIYIIGGIVDRNRLKRAAIGRAEGLQIPTAKLPLDEYLQKMSSTRVLTCNHVFDILMHYRQHQSWELALQSVLPQRKGAQISTTTTTTTTTTSSSSSSTKDNSEKETERTKADADVEKTVS